MSVTHSIAVLPGDGIGPDVVRQALKVLDAVSRRFNLSFYCQGGLIGGAAIEVHGEPLPAETLKLARSSDAVFLGSVGDFKYDTLDPAIRPEQGLLQIRKALGLFANLRPVKGYACLASISTLKPEIINGIDLTIVRELTGGLYFGQPKGRSMEENEEIAYDTMRYSRSEIERIARVGFEIAQQRSKKLLSVDKANVLASSQLWREVVSGLADEYPDVALSHMYVDNAAMQLILNPRQFDVMLTENTFGDILSDEASMLTGSLGLLPSASLGAEDAAGKRRALYEPCHGSAPQFKGQNKVNPIAQILSLSMMLELSFGYPDVARTIEQAVQSVLESGYRTFDVMSDGTTEVGTDEMGDLIAAAVSAPVTAS